MFQNQSIYIRCHNSFGINLGESTLFFTQMVFILPFGEKFEPIILVADGYLMFVTFLVQNMDVTFFNRVFFEK